MALVLGSLGHDILEEVHILALKYHWGRDEILDLPNWERVAYLQKIIRDAEYLQEEQERMLAEARRGHGG